MRGILTLALSFALAAAVGCSDDSDPIDPGTACFDYTSFTETPNVSFSADVLPIFRGSCAFGPCHGEETHTDPARVYLGNNVMAGDMTPAEIQEIFAQNVGQKAVAASGMEIIKAGDPENSFLMHKVDHTLDCAAIAGCSGATCRETMPKGSG